MTQNEMRFEEIVLNKCELRMLRQLKKIGDKHNAVQLNSENSSVSFEDMAILSRLSHFGFIDFYPCTAELPKGFPQWTLLKPESSEWEPPEMVCIANRGRDYLLHLKKLKYQKRIDAARYWITTAIAVLALVLSGISLAAELGLIQFPKT